MLILLCNFSFLLAEFITASPVLYRLLSLLDDWESFFVRKLDTHPTPSLNLFLPNDNHETRYGPALTRHKFILEPEHSPFRSACYLHVQLVIIARSLHDRTVLWPTFCTVVAYF